MFGMTTSRRITFFDRLAEYLKIAPEKQVFDKLNEVIDQELEVLGSSSERSVVLKLQSIIEKEYNLSKGALEYSFGQKSRQLSEPKKMWVLVTYAVIPDVPKVSKLIGNGCQKEHIYRYKRDFMEMSDNINHQKEFKEKFNQIIESYGKDTVL